MPTREDSIRLAAFIDGEGSIYIVKGKTKHGSSGGSLELMVCNTDPRLAVWCNSLYEGRVVTVRRKRWKPLFRWLVSGPVAEQVLRDCLEFFLIKRDQAELALAYRATFTRRKQRNVPEDISVRRNEMRTRMMRLNSRWHPPNDVSRADVRSA